MRRFKLLFLVPLIALLLIGPGLVESCFWTTIEYGVIDLARIEQEARRFSLLRQELNRLEQEFQQFRDEVLAEHARSLKELTEEIAKKTGENGIEQPVLEQEFRRRAEQLAGETQVQIDQKRAEIDQLKQEKETAVRDELRAVVKKVAQNRRVKTILLKERVMTGGRDVTDYVLKEWEKVLAKQEKERAAAAGEIGENKESEGGG